MIAQLSYLWLRHWSPFHSVIHLIPWTLNFDLWSTCQLYNSSFEEDGNAKIGPIKVNLEFSFSFLGFFVWTQTFTYSDFKPGIHFIFQFQIFSTIAVMLHFFTMDTYHCYLLVFFFMRLSSQNSSFELISQLSDWPI